MAELWSQLTFWWPGVNQGLVPSKQGLRGRLRSPGPLDSKEAEAEAEAMGGWGIGGFRVPGREEERKRGRPRGFRSVSVPLSEVLLPLRAGAPGLALW